MLPSRWTPFALRWAFPTAIDYYEALRPRITPSDAAIPVLFSQDRLCGFSCSIGMSLPGLRLHLYTGGLTLQQPDPAMAELDLSDHPKLSAVGRQQVNLAQYDAFLGGGLCQ